jgi:hypothetical protein
LPTGDCRFFTDKLVWQLPPSSIADQQSKIAKGRFAIVKQGAGQSQGPRATEIGIARESA